MKLIRYIYVALTAGLALAACDKADQAYKDYAPGGEITYPGKADSLKVNPGRERIELTWLLKTDPRIVKCRIYWNRKADSADVTVTRTSGADTIRHTLTGMAEGPYAFEVYTYNAQGSRSIKAETNGDVYGSFYESGLKNRGLKSAVISGGNAKLEWDESDPRSPAVELWYNNAAGEKQTRRIPASEKTTVVTGIPQTGTMEFKTLYLPVVNAIDTFATTAVKVNL